MNGISKNIIAVGFIMLMAVPALIFLTNKVQQNQINSNRSKKFKTEIIQTIIVSKEKVQWVKPGKEIVVNGKYFDVQFFAIEENNVHFTGYYDHKEDKLVKNLKNLIQQNTGDQNPYKNSAINYFFFAVYAQITDAGIEQQWKLNKCTYPVFSEKIIENYIQLYSPPPEL